MPKFSLKPVPHDNNVAIGVLPDGRQRLVHFRTMEGVDLPSGEWMLVFDEDGFGCVTNAANDSAAPLLLESMLRRVLHVSSSGEEFIVERDRRTGKYSTWSATSKAQQHEEIIVRFRAGATMAQHTISVFFLSWPRCGGGRYFWSALGVYDMLGLASYKGVPSKWVYASWKGWHSWLKNLGLEGSLQQSGQGRAQSSGGASASGFLPSPAMSTAALLALLNRWSGASVQKGGFREVRPRQAAAVVLIGILRACRLVKPMPLQIRFRQQREQQWPLPEKGLAHIVLEVQPDMSVDLTPWAEWHATNSSELGGRWFAALQIPSRLPIMDLSAFLTGMVGSSCLEPLLAQMVHQVGSHCEAAMYAAMKCGQPKGAIQAESLDLKAM